MHETSGQCSAFGLAIKPLVNQGQSGGHCQSDLILIEGKESIGRRSNGKGDMEKVYSAYDVKEHSANSSPALRTAAVQSNS